MPAAQQTSEATKEDSPLASASVVGQQFVQMYYRTLANSPEKLHHFFKESSTLSRADSVHDLDPKVASGLEEIKSATSGLDFSGHYIRIHSNVAHFAGRGITVVVFGCCRRGNMENEFTETFYLAPQDPNGYYVECAIYRNLTAVSGPVATDTEGPQSPVERDVPETVPDASTTTRVEPPVSTAPEPVAANAEATAAASVGVVEESKPVSQPQEQRRGGRRDRERRPKPDSGAEGALEEKAVPTADAASERVSAKEPCAAERGTGEARSSSTWAALLGGTSTLPSQEPQTTVVGTEDEYYGVFISRLPEGSSEQDLRKAVHKIGPTTEVALNEKGFGFVEFVSSEDARKAVHFGITVKGEFVRVETRRGRPRRDRDPRRSRRGRPAGEERPEDGRPRARQHRGGDGDGSRRSGAGREDRGGPRRAGRGGPSS
eukprot:Rmarinus@m.1314